MKKTLVWAHRGASGYAPENTVESFQKAIEMKADGIELDVQMTKDGELVIIHDETVDRVSDNTGWVKDFSYHELRKLNVNKTYSEYGKLTIPTLEEVLSLVKETELTVNVELKNGIVFYENMEEKVLSLTVKLGMQNRIVYSSFNHSSVMKLKQLDPNVKTGFLYSDGYLGMPEYTLRCGVEALHPALYNLQYPNFIAECKKKNIELRVWTVNEKQHMEMMCESGIDVMFTNFPDIGLNIVDAYERKKRDGR